MSRWSRSTPAWSTEISSSSRSPRPVQSPSAFLCTRALPPSVTSPSGPRWTTTSSPTTRPTSPPSWWRSLPWRQRLTLLIPSCFSVAGLYCSCVCLFDIASSQRRAGLFAQGLGVEWGGCGELGEGEKSGSSVFLVFWLLGLFRVFVDVLFFFIAALRDRWWYQNRVISVWPPLIFGKLFCNFGRKSRSKSPV